MARAFVSDKDLPPEASALAERIRLLGFDWVYVPDHRLASLAKRVQVRDTAAVAPPRETARYALALQRGDVMPPVVVTADGYLVDGATRTEAARKLGWTSYPAFRLNVNYEGAPTALVQQLVMLGSAFNLTHGRGMSPTNIEAVIEAVTEEDDSPRDIARKLHISEVTVAGVMNAAKARKRAANLDIQVGEFLTSSHLRVFGGKSAKYTDPVFKEFFTLAQDAHLTISAVQDLARQLEAEGTEQARMDILAAERASYQGVIDGASSVPSRAAKLRRSLGFLNAQDDPGLLVELSPAAAEDHIRSLTVARERIDRVIAAQRRVEGSRRTGRR